MKDTKENFRKVSKLAKGYLLPKKYEPNPDKLLLYCYEFILSSTGDHEPTDEELFQLVDEYFNL